MEIAALFADERVPQQDLELSPHIKVCTSSPVHG
jgi:hypothetical protein